MKLAYLILALVLFTGTAALAQQKRDTIHHASTSKKKAKMKEELNLSDKQSAEIKASKKEYKDEKEKIKNDTKLTEAQKKQKIDQLKAEKKKDKKKKG